MFALDDPTERIYEAFVEFERELSVVAARAADGSFAHWGVIDNEHRRGSKQYPEEVGRQPGEE